MADVQEKSRGLTFAERQLLRHGWEHGKGLGRAEDGISEALKVKVKCDKGGVGHKEGDQFTFHWWDHVFNKASSSLQVQSDQDGIKLKKTAEEDEDGGVISNKKPRKAALCKAKLYGRFVKSATLLSGQEQPEHESVSSETSSDQEEDQRLDLSSTTKLSDADLMKACGGRTAHKGARHGLTMSAKLARLEEQEARFMAAHGNAGRPVCVTAAPLTHDATTKTKRSAASGHEASESPKTDVEPKKKKKKKKKGDAEERSGAASSDEDVTCASELSPETKRKPKKKKTSTQQEAAESLQEMPELHGHNNMKKKKKKKSSKHENHDTESGQTEPVQNGAAVSLQEAEVTQEKSVEKRKRKKCKKDKLSTDDTLPAKKKKKKKPTV